MNRQLVYPLATTEKKLWAHLILKQESLYKYRTNYLMN